MFTAVDLRPRPLLAGAPLSFTAPVSEPARYVVTCVPARGEAGELRNWSLTHLNNSEFAHRLRDELPEVSSRNYFAPTVKHMSAALLEHNVFSVVRSIGRSHNILRPAFKAGSDDQLKCDGTHIEKGQGFVMSAGGCPLVVLTGMTQYQQEICVVAHAGRDSLFDRNRIDITGDPRTYFSVVDAMVSYAMDFGVDQKDMILRSFFSLPTMAFPHDLSDSKHGAANSRLWGSLKQIGMETAFVRRHDNVRCLALSVLIRLQAEALGVGTIESGLLELPEDGDFAYTRHADPALAGNMRNLVYLTWR